MIHVNWLHSNGPRFYEVLKRKKFGSAYDVSDRLFFSVGLEQES